MAKFDDPIATELRAADVLGNAPKFPVLDKKASGAFKNKLDLHVLLIIQQNGLTKSQALVQAYHEGVEALGKRLG